VQLIEFQENQSNKMRDTGGKVLRSRGKCSYLLREGEKIYKAAHPVYNVRYGVSTNAFERNRGTEGKVLSPPSKLPFVFDPGQQNLHYTERMREKYEV
jgi:hypothetical protein